MKTPLRLEELLMFALALYLFSKLGASWGLFALLLFAPGLSILGYLANSRFGAWTYNLIHHKGLAIALYAFGSLLTVPWLMFAGALLFAHPSFDRVFGYGLKYEDSFHNTHLGRIGG